ncbi:hypothetical protein [Pseudomonas sp. C2B4]|uniref:hypothetical protein n=1 Tax=Pseudomonas sp. C2B4 TaxID=2735270 RepID=UPI0015861D99|nr:hypothetical protein [Pseudomonas sp. C2B4]NUU38417.1 hypothetical protein [Pseudomonas sp. C2B4]
MKIADLDMRELIDAIGVAVVPVIFKDVNKETPPHALRERFRLNAEIMGRFAAVLYCGDEISLDTLDLISLFTTHMRVEHLQSMNQLLGPEGDLSRLVGPSARTT